jgi:hypothetical protein
MEVDQGPNWGCSSKRKTINNCVTCVCPIWCYFFFIRSKTMKNYCTCVTEFASIIQWLGLLHPANWLTAVFDSPPQFFSITFRPALRPHSLLPGNKPDSACSKYWECIDRHYWYCRQQSQRRSTVHIPINLPANFGAHGCRRAFYCKGNGFLRATLSYATARSVSLTSMWLTTQFGRFDIDWNFI